MLCRALYLESKFSRLFYAAKDEQRDVAVMGTKLHPKTKNGRRAVLGVEEASELLQRFFSSKKKNNSIQIKTKGHIKSTFEICPF